MGKDTTTAWKNAPFSVYAWAEDFIGYLSKRPKFVRLLLKFIFGKYAYREFIGMVDVFKDCEMYIGIVPECDYHKEKVRNDFVEGLKLL